MKTKACQRPGTESLSSNCCVVPSVGIFGVSDAFLLGDSLYFFTNILNAFSNENMALTKKHVLHGISCLKQNDTKHSFSTVSRLLAR